MKAFAIAALLALALAPGAHAAPSRVDAIARALDAVRALGPAGRDRLDRDIYEATRARCHTDAAAPTARCSIEAARAACATASDAAACDAAADVIATNLRSVGDFVDDAARARLVRASADYHAALAAALRRRYALLAAELALELAAGGSDAAAIDRLCARRDRALPWPRCVAALVWFVGGAASGGAP